MARVLLMLAACAWLATVPARAEEFPTRPIKLVVATAAGGASDLVARAVGAKLGEIVGQQIIVEPRPGANGTLAAELVAASPADGYTIMMGTIGALAINPLVYPNVNYQPMRDFAPIAQLVDFGNILVVHPSVPANSVPELIALAKQKPGSLNYGSPGTGGSPHMAMVVFERMAGVKLVHVPYKGAALALNDLLAGQIQAAFSDSVATLPHIAAGKVRALAVSSKQRLAAAPDIPTVAEAGLPGFDVAGWLGIVAPAKLAPERIAQLNAAINKAVATPEVTQRLVAMGATITTGTPDKFAAFIRGENERWAKVIAETGIKAE
jgi:tripartite-type tricarboxylate transporter receptor subunit TctC